MLKRFRAIVVAGAVAAAIAGSVRTASAQGFITPFIGFNFGGDSANCVSLTNCNEKRTNFGVSIGTLSVIGFEEDISYAKNFFGDVPNTDNSVFSLMSNLMVAIPAGPIHPYVLGGFGLIRSHVTSPLANISNFDKNSFGYDLGGGVHIIFGHVGVRGDLRRFNTFTDLPVISGTFNNTKLEYWRGSAGLTLAW